MDVSEEEVMVVGGLGTGQERAGDRRAGDIGRTNSGLKSRGSLTRSRLRSLGSLIISRLRRAGEIGWRTSDLSSLGSA